MNRFRWLFLVLLVGVGGAVVAAPGPRSTRDTTQEADTGTATELPPAADPFPIRRLRVAPGAWPELRDELEPGPWVQLPRRDFEARVHAAAQAAELAKAAPRIVAADYTAEFDGHELFGTAEWQFLNPQTKPLFAPLEPVRLAIQRAQWADGEDALLAIPSAATAPAVWLPRPGRRTLQLNWSLTGTTELGERRFELRVPPCATAVWRLNVPADQVPAASDALLTGPFPIPGKLDRRLWQLRPGHSSKVELTLRRRGASDAVAQAKLAAQYDFTAGQLAATFRYELNPARGPVDEWSFLADPGWHITDVVMNNRAAWTVDPPEVPEGPRRVRLRLRQPGPGGPVVISAIALFPDSARSIEAPLPAIRPLAAIVTEETLELRIGSGWKIEAWNAGDYRLTGGSLVPSSLLGGGETTRVLTLEGTLLAPGVQESVRRLPSFRLSPPEAEVVTTERVTWTLGETRASLSARVDVRVRRGPLFQLSLRPPPGYVLDRNPVAIHERVSYVGPLAGGTQLIEFVPPLGSGQNLQLQLEFRGPPVQPGVMPLPAWGFGAAEREGWFSIRTSPRWTMTIQPGVGAEPVSLWSWLTTDIPRDAPAVYYYRGKEPEGHVTLRAATPTFTAHAAVRLNTVDDRWSLTTRWLLRISGGELTTIAVAVPQPDGPRTWRVVGDGNAIREAIRVPGEVFALLPGGLPWSGSWWVLRFQRPLAALAELETVALGPPVGDTPVTLPIPQMLGVQPTVRADVAPPWQPRVALQIAGDRLHVTPQVPTPTPPVVQDAYLVTVVRAASDVIVALGGSVSHSNGSPLQVALPPGVQVRSVNVQGRWLHPAACLERDTTDRLRIPLPVGTDIRFEVRYRLPVSWAWPTYPITSPAPRVNGSELPVQRWWAFAAGMLPGWPARPWDATAEEPPLLGGSLTSGEVIVLATRADDTWIRVGSSRVARALAVILAAGIVVWGLGVLPRQRVGDLLLLAGFTGVSLGVFYLGPPWWAQVAGLPVGSIVLCWAWVGLARLVPRRGVRIATAATAAATLLLGIPTWPLWAQGPTAATVLIVPNDRGTEDVFVPRAVLDRLATLTQPPPPAPVITSAEYAIQTEDTTATVTARLIVHAFAPQENTITLTLSDVRLERVAVNGRVAFPTTNRPESYSIPLPGPGRHDMELRFATSIVTTGSEREIRFGIPEVPRCRVVASLTKNARQPQLINRWGRQITTTDTHSRLEADLGAVKAVHLRWREGASGAAVLRVREACVWDMNDAGAELTAAYLIRVEQGTVADFTFEIPPELEVVRVTARNLDLASAWLSLRDWSTVETKGRHRLLRTEFQNPTAGRFLIVFQAVPRRPMSRQPVLRFPRMALTQLTAESESVYGLRTTRVTLESLGLSAVSDFPVEALRDFVNVPDLRLETQPLQRVFRPTGPGAELRPSVRVGEAITVQTTTAWQVGPHRADAAGTIVWTAKEPQLLLEWTLPGVRLLDVRGSEVASWHQSGSRVQVWLRTSVREGTLEWRGTVMPTPAGKIPAEPIAFDAVRPRISGGRPAREDVRVKVVPGWLAEIERDRGWQATPSANGAWQWVATIASPPDVRLKLVPQRR
jgi:hypothetical protein